MGSELGTGRTQVWQVRSSEKEPFFSLFFILLLFFIIIFFFLYFFFSFFFSFFFHFFSSFITALFLFFFYFFFSFYFILFFFHYFSFLRSSEKGTSLSPNSGPAEQGFNLFLSPNSEPGFGPVLSLNSEPARVQSSEKRTGLSPNQGSARFLLQTPNLPGFEVHRKELAFLGTPNLPNQGYTRSFSEHRTCRARVIPVLSPNSGQKRDPGPSWKPQPQKITTLERSDATTTENHCLARSEATTADNHCLRTVRSQSHRKSLP